MHNLEKIKRRFLRNNFSMCLGCIASNLARLESFSKMPDNKEAIYSLIEESKFFIEWVTPHARPDIQVELVNTQLKLALWNYSKDHKQISKESRRLSKRILGLSGLLSK